MAGQLNEPAMHKLSDLLYRNTANFVSLLGVLPLCLLFGEGGYQYLLPLMIYSNVMDDLDGILAGKLNIRSQFGAHLDNVCDAIGHSLFAMLVGMHFGGICLIASLVGTMAIVLRSVARLDPEKAGGGSPTNELIRHLLFVLVLSESFQFYAAPYLIAAFVLNAFSMLMPFKMPYLIRSLTKSATTIGLVNVALLTAWLVPDTAPFIAASFLATYLYSFGVALWQGNREASPPTVLPHAGSV